MADYVSIADFRSVASIPSGHTSEIQFAITAGSRAVERYCGRVFAQSTGSRVYAACHTWTLEVDDIASTSGVTVKSDTANDGTFAQTWTASQFQLEPLNGLLDGQPWAYTSIRAITNSFLVSGATDLALVQVTATWGWPSVPAEVTSGTFMLATDIYKSKDAPFGVAGSTEWGVLRIRENSQLCQLLMPFRKHSAMVG